MAQIVKEKAWCVISLPVDLGRKPATSTPSAFLVALELTPKGVIADVERSGAFLFISADFLKSREDELPLRLAEGHTHERQRSLLDLANAEVRRQVLHVEHSFVLAPTIEPGLNTALQLFNPAGPAVMEELVEDGGRELEELREVPGAEPLQGPARKRDEVLHPHPNRG